MTRHVHIVHHRKGPFLCPISSCGMKFTRKDFFFCHKKTHPELRLLAELPEEDLRRQDEEKKAKAANKTREKRKSESDHLMYT
jgi:hypothetical protein